MPSLSRCTSRRHSGEHPGDVGQTILPTWHVGLGALCPSGSTLGAEPASSPHVYTAPDRGVRMKAVVSGFVLGLERRRLSLTEGADRGPLSQ